MLYQFRNNNVSLWVIFIDGNFLSAIVLYLNLIIRSQVRDGATVTLSKPEIISRAPLFRS